MTYEYRYICATDNYVAVSLDALNAAGADGWRVVAAMSRPGLMDNVLLMREVPIAKKAVPAHKAVPAKVAVR